MGLFLDEARITKSGLRRGVSLMRRCRERGVDVDAYHMLAAMQVRDALFGDFFHDYSPDHTSCHLTVARRGNPNSAVCFHNRRSRIIATRLSNDPCSTHIVVEMWQSIYPRASQWVGILGHGIPSFPYRRPYRSIIHKEFRCAPQYLIVMSKSL